MLLKTSKPATIYVNHTMWLQCLAFYEHSCVFIKQCTTVVKSQFRAWLGPEPQDYYLFSDGSVLPTSISLPSSVVATTYHYDCTMHRLSPAAPPAAPGRFRPVPIIALRVERDDVGSTDISEWIGDLRQLGMTEAPNVKQLLQLYALVSNTFVPLSDATVYLTRNDGTEVTISV